MGVFLFIDNIRDLCDHLLLARSEAEKSGDDESLEKLNDTYLVQTLSDIFFGENLLYPLKYSSVFFSYIYYSTQKGETLLIMLGGSHV